MTLTKPQVDALKDGIKATFDNLELQLDTKAFQEALPLVGNELHTAFSGGSAPTKHLSSIKTKVLQVLDQYASGGDTAAMATGINNALAAEGLGTVQFETSAGAAVQMVFSSGKTYAQKVAGVAETNLGLPGVGLQVQGQATETQVGYDLALKVGLLQNSNSFYVDASNDSLTVHLDAKTVGNTNSGATLGPSSYTADFSNAATGGNTHFTADVGLDIAGTGRITIPTLKAAKTVTATVTGAAEVHADLTANGGAVYAPNLHSQLNVGWLFNHAVLNGAAANDLTFGERPTVSFTEVQANLNNFVANTLEPIFAPLATGIGGLAQVVHALNTPLPVLGDLGLPNTLAEFIEAFGNNTAGFASTVSVLDEALGFVSNVSAAGLVNWVDLGSLTLGNSQDIRAKNFSLSGLNLGNATVLRAAASSDVADFLSEAAGITLPVFDSSRNDAFTYLLGGTANFLEANLPELSAQFGFSQYFPIIGPLGVAINGDFAITANVDFGIGSSGFYLDDHKVGGKDLPEVSLSASLLAAAELNLGIARGGVGGGLFADVLLDLRDPNADGRVTLSELNQDLALGHLFNTRGHVDIGLQAYLKLGIGPFSKTFSKDLGRLTLLDFTRGMDSVNAQPPVLGEVQPDKTLLLHVGKFAELRDYGNLSDQGYLSNEFLSDREGAIEATGTPDTWILSKTATGIEARRSEVNAPATSQVLKGATDIHIVAADANMPGISLQGKGVPGFSPVTVPFLYEGGEGFDYVLGGDGVNTLKGGGGGDYLRGGKAKDVLRGDGGDDNLDGGGGNDALYGGPGDDYFANDSGADIYSGEDGLDTVEYFYATPVTVTLKLDPFNKTRSIGTAKQGTETDSLFSIEKIIGGTGHDVFHGSPLNDIFFGGAGNDFMHGAEGDDYFNGGPGADTIDGGGSATGGVLANPGKDTVSYKGSDVGVTVQLLANVVSGGWAQGDVLTHIVNVEGSDWNDTLSGDNGQNALYGGAGNDTILSDTISGVGADLLVGGEGADYILADASDTASWADSRGGVSVDLSQGTASNSGESTGNANGDTFTNVQRVILSNYSDVFLGNVFDNWVNPGLSRESKTAFGRDSLDGGGGTDTLVVDFSVGDRVDGLAGANGTNNSNGYFLERSLRGNLFEEVVAKNFEQLNFTGGRQNDHIHGLPGADVLLGGGGNDTLSGEGGSDYIDGGSGDDMLSILYTGNENSLTVANLVGGSGFDTIQLDLFDTVSGITVSPAFMDAGILNVSFSGAEVVKIFSGSGGDVFNAGAYRAVIYAGEGEDVVNGGTGNDELVGEGGDDHLNGGAGDDAIYGSEGDDFITGSAGFDTVYGGSGDDTLDFNGMTFTVPILMAPGYFSTGSGTKAIRSTQYYQIEHMNLQGTKYNDLIHGSPGEDQLAAGAGNDSVFGNEGNDFLNGNAGNDSLDGGTGADLMYGREGNDRYYVDNVGDDVRESAKEGTDTVFSRLNSYTLPSEVENLVLETGAEFGLGNAKKNTIIGNNQANTFMGGGGGDIFQGLGGRDTYYVDTSKDLVQERMGAGTDKVIASISYILAANVEDLYLTGTATKGTGNALANIIAGNSRNNDLSGEAGNDTLVGGDATAGWSGDGERDTLIGGSGKDIFVLGKAGVHYYDDDAAGSGFGDFALLKDFDVRFDKLMLGSPVSEFHLKPVHYNPINKSAGLPFGALEKANAQGLFFDSDASGGYSTGDELLAVLPTKPFDLDLVDVPDSAWI